MLIKTFAAVLMSVALLTLLVVLILPTSTRARESSGTTTLIPVQDLVESERAAISQEIKVFATSQISVRDVIKIAEARAPGAKVIDVSFDGSADRIAYRVKTYLNDEISAVTIDASTGKTLGDAVVTPVSALGVKEKIELAGFSAAVIDLSNVVSVAESYGFGKAVSVGLEEENGKLIFLVVVVTDGSLKLISVDPNEQNRPRNASFRKKK